MIQTMLRVFAISAFFAPVYDIFGDVARAEVFEFDRQGRRIERAASALDKSHKVTYDMSIPHVAISTRGASGFAALYRPMAEAVSTTYASDPAVAAAGLSPEDFTRLFVALIDQESRFDPRAVSPKGARGLGQLMPETAAALGVRDAFEPMENLRGAARYLTHQLRAFGRADLALAAYNAGPHRVTQYQGIPPFRETRDYVARITRAAALAPTPALAGERTIAAPAAFAVAEVATPKRVATAAPSFPTAKGSVLEWQD